MGSVLVLDLDETLFHAVSASDCGFEGTLEEWMERCALIKQQAEAHDLQCVISKTYLIFVRPKAVEFLQLVRQLFQCIIVFTAASKSHAEFAKKSVFEEMARVHVDFLFDRAACGKDVDDKCGNNRIQTTLVDHQKNLSTIIESVRAKRSLDWDDCLFVDDSWQHTTTNCGEMLIVPKFNYRCLRAWCLAGKVDPMQLAQLVCEDDVLLRLGRFILNKSAQKPSIKWCQVDKRFALFFPSLGQQTTNASKVDHTHHRHRRRQTSDRKISVHANARNKIK